AQLSLDDPAHERRARELAAESVALGVADRIVPGTGEPVDQLSVAADGSRIATADPQGVVRLWDPETLSSVELEHGAGTAVYHLAFAPDGQSLAIAGTAGLELVDVRTRKRRPVTGHRGAVYAVGFTPDAAALVTSGEDGAVLRIELESGNARSLAQFDA